MAATMGFYLRQMPTPPKKNTTFVACAAGICVEAIIGSITNRYGVCRIGRLVFQ